MNFTITKVVFFLILISTALANVSLEFFRGWNDGEYIKLEWKIEPGEEIKIKQFEVWRATTQTPYAKIETILPEDGKDFYTYVDKNAYKPIDMVFKYKIIFVEKNGQTSESHEYIVGSNPSGVKRTWGSIKAMFR
jgi:hypothetical protein